MAGRRLCSRSSKCCEIRIWSTSWHGDLGRELQAAGTRAGRVRRHRAGRAAGPARSASSACSQRRPAVEVANHVLQVELEQALLVEVVDDVLGQLADDRLAVEEAELIGQVIVERAGTRGHVLHGFLLAVGLFAERRPAPPRPFVVELAPVLIEADQAVELVGLGVRLPALSPRERRSPRHRPRWRTTSRSLPGPGSRPAPARSVPAMP